MIKAKRTVTVKVTDNDFRIKEEEKDLEYIKYDGNKLKSTDEARLAVSAVDKINRLIKLANILNKKVAKLERTVCKK